MSDRIIVMKSGHIEQSGTASEIYNYPRTEFVADFVGSANLVGGHLRRDLSGNGLVAVETPGGDVVHGTAHGRAPAADAVMSIRTVHLQLAAAAPVAGAKNVWPVVVKRSVFLGDMTQLHVDWAGREVVIRQSAGQQWREGQQAYLTVAPENCVLLEAG
jgi:iron(III) transport system ATP-binding protein